MIDTTKSILLQQRERILKRLADLAVRDRKPNVVEKYRIEAEFLLSELNEADEALKSRRAPRQDQICEISASYRRNRSPSLGS